MKRKIILILIVIVIIGFGLCFKLFPKNQIGQAENVINTEQGIVNSKIEDLDFLCDNLEMKHKNLYGKVSKEEFLCEKQKVIDKIDDLSESQFYFELKHLISLVGDGHTNITYKGLLYEHLPVLCFSIRKFDDGWHLTKLEEENSRYLGYLLTEINNVSIEDIYEKAKSIISYDNETWRQVQFSSTVNLYDALEYLGVLQGEEEVNLTLKKDRSGEEENLILKPLYQKDMEDSDVAEFQQKETPITAMKGIYNSCPIDENIYYIQYNMCSEDPDLTIKDFTKKISNDLKNNSYKKLIIDLRYNTGGNSDILAPVIKCISNYKKNNKLDIYTLIGEKTFSSAVINSIELKDELNATLVGSETGGSVNCYGEIKTFDLPNLPMTVIYSTKYFELIKGYNKDSLCPDIPVEKSFENYKNGIDSDLEAILKL